MPSRPTPPADHASEISDLSRFSGTADSVVPLGRVVKSVDLSSPENRANRETAKRLLAEARKTK